MELLGVGGVVEGIRNFGCGRFSFRDLKVGGMIELRFFFFGESLIGLLRVDRGRFFCRLG